MINKTKLNMTLPSLASTTQNRSEASMNHMKTSLQRSQSGFTLIELMVVIVIMTILAGVVGFNVLGQVDKSRVGTTETALSVVASGLDTYRLDNSRYPTSSQGLDALIKPPAEAKNYPEGGYLTGGEYPTDSWDNELQYVIPGTEGRPYDLFSLGADGEQGGEGLDADIYHQP